MKVRFGNGNGHGYGEGLKRLEEAIGRILCPEGRRPFIWAARYRAARAANPGTSPTKGGMRGQATLGPPIRPCSAWGLPCPLRFRRGGALLPHPFTLTLDQIEGGLLSAALSLALPRPGVTRHAACRGVRTFLQDRNPSGRPPPPAAPSIPPGFPKRSNQGFNGVRRRRSRRSPKANPARSGSEDGNHAAGLRPGPHRRRLS